MRRIKAHNFHCRGREIFNSKCFRYKFHKFLLAHDTRLLSFTATALHQFFKPVSTQSLFIYISLYYFSLSLNLEILKFKKKKNPLQIVFIFRSYYPFFFFFFFLCILIIFTNVGARKSRLGVNQETYQNFPKLSDRTEAQTSLVVTIAVHKFSMKFSLFLNASIVFLFSLFSN